MDVDGSFFLSIRHYAHGVTPLANDWRSLQFSTQRHLFLVNLVKKSNFTTKQTPKSCKVNNYKHLDIIPRVIIRLIFLVVIVAPCCITSSKDFWNIFKHSISIFIWVPTKFCRVATFGTCTSFLVLIAVHCRSLFCSVFCALVIALWLQVSLWSPLNGSYRLQNATRCYKYSFLHAMFLFKNVNVMIFPTEIPCHKSPRHWSFSTTGTWTWRCTGTWTTSSMNSICGTLWRHSNRASCVNRSIEASKWTNLTIFLLISDSLIPSLDVHERCNFQLQKCENACRHTTASIGVNRLHHV